MVVTVYAFSNWLEVGLLLGKDAYLVMEWFYVNVVYRFRVPLLVSSDCGLEFSGAFGPYLQNLYVY